MSASLASRLRELARLPKCPGPPAGDGPPEGDSPHHEGKPRGGDSPQPAIDAQPQRVGEWLADAAARALGGDIVSTGLGACVVVDRRYAEDHRHGFVPLGACAANLDAAGPSFGLLAGAGHAPSDESCRPLMFVDIETTGLAGGAGTHAFLVGCAWFEERTFRVQQFFMVGHALERALLRMVRERVDAAGPLVSYNGRTFDVPLLETRFVFHRQAPPFAERAHLDMLPVARRLWRFARPVVDVPGMQTDSCALGALERVLFGVQRTGDVPGSQIPGRYFTFLRTGDATPLEPVLEHNRLDLVSLAALTARALRLLDTAPEGTERPRESLGLGRLLERVGLFERAEACFERAIAMTAGSWHDDDEQVSAEARRSLALRCRRTARYAAAAAHWEALTRLRRCPPSLRREALEALAIHHEHRSRDLDRAQAFAEQSERLARARHELDDASRRMARLRRKQQARAVLPARTLWN